MDIKHREEVVLQIVNNVINSSAVDDSQTDDMTEAMLKVLSRQSEPKNAAAMHKVSYQVLEMLVRDAERQLERNSSSKDRKESENSVQINGQGEHSKDDTKEGSSENGNDENQKRQQNGGAMMANDLGNESGSKMNSDKTKGQRVARDIKEDHNRQPQQRQMKQPTKGGRAKLGKKSSGLEPEDEEEEEVELGQQKNKPVEEKKTEPPREKVPMKRGRKPKAKKMEDNSAKTVSGDTPTTEGRTRQSKRKMNNDDNKKEEPVIKEPPAKRRRAANKSKPKIEDVDVVPETDEEELAATANQPIKKTRRRSALDLLKAEARSFSSNANEAERLSMALTIYRGGAPPVPAEPFKKSSGTQQRVRRSNNAGANSSMKAIGWKDETLNDTASSTALVPLHMSANSATHDVSVGGRGKLIRDHPRWHTFTRVVDDVVNEVLERMANRNTTDQERHDITKKAILDILRNGMTIKSAQEKWAGVGLSTLRRYSRDVRVRIDACLGPDILDDAFFSQFDEDQVTLQELRAAIVKASSSTPNSQPRAIPMLLNPSQSKKTLRSSKKGEKTNIFGANTDTSKLTAGAAMQPYSSSFEGSSNNVPQSDTAVDLALSELIPMSSQLRKSIEGQQVQALLTRRANQQRIKFSGTKTEFLKLVTETLRNKYAGEVDKLATLFTNHMHNEKYLMLQQNRFGITPNLLLAAYNLVGRYIEMESLEFVDLVDDAE